MAAGVTLALAGILTAIVIGTVCFGFLTISVAGTVDFAALEADHDYRSFRHGCPRPSFSGDDIGR